MADLSELLAAEAHRLQPTDPPPFDELVRTRRMRDRRNRLAAGTLMLLAVAGVAMTATLFGAERSATDTAASPSGRVATTSPPAGSVTAHLTLSATSVRAGESLTGQITVENNTGQPIRVEGCDSIYQVSLVGGDHQGAPPRLACLQFFTIPVGKSTYPARVTAAYDHCSSITNQPRPCPDAGGLPPLPYGEYAATAFASDDEAPLPEPLAVTVLP